MIATHQSMYSSDDQCIRHVFTLNNFKNVRHVDICKDLTL